VSLAKEKYMAQDRMAKNMRLGTYGNCAITFRDKDDEGNNIFPWHDGVTVVIDEKWAHATFLDGDDAEVFEEN
jgi:hypothetical protein